MEDVKGSYRPTTDDSKQKRGSSFDLPHIILTNGRSALIETLPPETY